MNDPSTSETDGEPAHQTRVTITKHARTLAILSSSSAVLAVLSLGFAWFKVRYSGYSDLLPGGIFKGEYTCYPDYFALSGLDYNVVSLYRLLGVNDYGDLMTVVSLLVVLSASSSILFVGAALFDRARIAAVFGLLSACFALSAVLFFALTVDDTLVLFHGTELDLFHGFTGSDSDPSGTDWTWGPAIGWALMAVSAITTSACASAWILVNSPRLLVRRS